MLKIHFGNYHKRNDMNSLQLAHTLMTSLQKGKICKVRWIKNDGVQRVARVRLWSKSGITDYPRIGINPVVHTGQYITCEDVDKKRATGGGNKGWINVSLNNILEVKVESKSFLNWIIGG